MDSETKQYIQRIEGIVNRTEERVRAMEARFNEKIDEGFHGIEKRLETMDVKIASLNEKLGMK